MLGQDCELRESDWQELCRHCSMTSDELQQVVDGVAAAPGHRLDDWHLLLGVELNQVQRRLLESRLPAVSEPGCPGDRSERLLALREVIKQQGWDGFLIPRADEYQGEEIPLCAQRLPWLTGFRGSAGLAVVLTDKAALFVDGRYTLQGSKEVDTNLLTVKLSASLPDDVAEWLSVTLPDGGRIAYDPWLHSCREVERLGRSLQGRAELVQCLSNPVDEIWLDRPAAPLAPGMIHPIDYAGQDSFSKRQQLAQRMQQSKANLVLLTRPDSIAWLFNFRGQDLAYAPLLLGYALLRGDASATLFVAQRKLSEELRSHLGESVTVQPFSSLESNLKKLSQDGSSILLDPQTAPAQIPAIIREAGGKIQRGDDPCRKLKAVKNAVEIEGARQAHLRDGLAWVRFLHWLTGRASTGEVSELSAAQEFLAQRQRDPQFRSLSFPTISAAGANGAVVHYRAEQCSDKQLLEGEFYLVDGGGQYPDGTTDATRTVAIGEVSLEMRERFTLVLKGHICLARARFPHDVSGSQLDGLARVHLWQAGLDYAHGTGHGVGSYLCVHEQPPAISKTSTTTLAAGMIVSGEPGYCQGGAYGIRIENLLLVRPDPELPHMLSFETLTLIPIDLSALLPSMLTQEERSWLDSYHARIAQQLCPLLEDEPAQWLRAVTAPV